MGLTKYKLTFVNPIGNLLGRYGILNRNIPAVLRPAVY
jgi:hypothetical protein